MYCTQCGGLLPEEARFCPKCGTPVPADPVPEEPQVIPEQTEEPVDQPAPEEMPEAAGEAPAEATEGAAEAAEPVETVEAALVEE